jgi:hypothetical protein
MIDAVEAKCSPIIERTCGIGREVDDWQRVSAVREGEALLVLLQPYGLRIKLPLRVANGWRFRSGPANPGNRQQNATTGGGRKMDAKPRPTPAKTHLDTKPPSANACYARPPLRFSSAAGA